MQRFFLFKILLISCPVLLGVGCSKESATSNEPTLPHSWYADTDAHDPATTEVDDVPSSELTEAVQATFQAHTQSLDEVSQLSTAFNRVQTTDAPTRHRADWTPWHLDGMIGAFAINVSGVFGALVASGEPSVQVTWQKKTVAADRPRVQARGEKNTFLFTSDMTSNDVSRMLEPAIQMAVSTHSVRNSEKLRRNVTTEAMKFLSVSRILNSIPGLSGWQIEGYQIRLFFTAEGDLTPTTSLGGTFALMFDWEASAPKESSNVVPLSAREQQLQKNMGSFLQTVSVLIPEARAQASEIREAGFELGALELGVSFTVGGDIGIASSRATCEGRLLFKKKEDSTPTPIRANLNSSFPINDSIGVVSPGPTGPAVQTLSASSARSEGDDFAYRIETKTFRRGIRRAIKMGSFFARHAAQADTSVWKISEIELGFDASVSGDVKMVTVGGSGLIRLGFERKEVKK